MKSKAKSKRIKKKKKEKNQKEDDDDDDGKGGSEQQTNKFTKYNILCPLFPVKTMKHRECCLQNARPFLSSTPKSKNLKLIEGKKLQFFLVLSIISTIFFRVLLGHEQWGTRRASTRRTKTKKM